MSEYFQQKGCTIPFAMNFNSSAIITDGSCYVDHYKGSYLTDNCNTY
jgi:hypothetical protein